MIFKTEGPTDLLALLSAGINQGDAAFCNVHGCSENPAETPFLPSIVENQDVIVVHDRDKPGLDGATMVGDRPGWATWLGQFANRCRLAHLPYELVESKGKDLRDYFNDGWKAADLYALAEAGDVIGESGVAVDWIDEREDDPHRLAKINLDDYQGAHGGRLVYWRDEWLKYKSGVYQKIARNDLRSKVNASIRAEMINQWRHRQRTGQDTEKPVRVVSSSLVTNVIEAMQSMTRISWNIEMQSSIDTREAKNYVSMKNGILDLDAVFARKPPEQCLLPHSDNWFSTVKLAYDFIPDATCPLWEEFLQKTFEGDQERIDLVQEWAGYLLTKGNPKQKFLALEGEGGNGKTVFLAAMSAMIGDENISAVPLEKFGGRFDLNETVGKMANICGDVGEIDRVAEGHLKDFTGSGAMSFDRKGIAPIKCVPTAKLMMSWNTRPRFRDRSMGLWRRMLLVPFNRPVPEAERIDGMAEVDWWIRQGEASGILLWAIAGLHRLRRQTKFTEPHASKQASDDYRKETNPALEFFDDHLELHEDTYIKADWLYRVYVHWCEKSGHRALGNRQFGKEVRKCFSEVKRNRSTAAGRPWIYEGIKFSTDEIFSLETEDPNRLF